ncbi:MAG: hypothetical protein IJQ80_02380 [Clostridia bacterium]|nr:hypothetical protein [Clostridia bacterium]
MKPQSPCRGCEEREGGCHATCERYAEYRESFEKWRDTVNEERQKEVQADIFRKVTAWRVIRHKEKG